MQTTVPYSNVKMESTKKPFKLVSSNREIKKGVAAGSLNELAKKANTFLGISEAEVKFVLEEDGTEIAEDEYLLSLDSQTVLMALNKSDVWTPSLAMLDETDRATTLNYNAVEILQRVRKNPCSIVLLSEEELDVVVSSNSHSSKIAGVNQSEIDYLKDACERELERKQRQKNALDLMDILRKANESTNTENENE